MGSYDYEIRQSLREIARDMRSLIKTVEGIDKRLATYGGLTNTLTRRAHLVVDGGKVYCSACGKQCGEWLSDNECTIACYGDKCKNCGAAFDGEVVES